MWVFWFLLQISSIVSIFLSLLPFTTILILNCVLYYNLRKKRIFIKSQSSQSTRRCMDDQKIRREHYVAAMLVLIILVYACCHSIRRLSAFFSILLFLFLLSILNILIVKLHPEYPEIQFLISFILSIDEGPSSRTYFNVKELLVSAGGERR